MPPKRSVDVKVRGGDLRMNMPSKRNRWWLRWQAKLILFSAVGIAGFFDHAFAAWGAPITVAAIALFLPVLYWREFWDQIWFWITMALLAAIQAPLVIVMRPLIEERRTF